MAQSRAVPAPVMPPPENLPVRSSGSFLPAVPLPQQVLFQAPRYAGTVPGTAPVILPDSVSAVLFRNKFKNNFFKNKIILRFFLKKVQFSFVIIKFVHITHIFLCKIFSFYQK